MTDHAVTVTAFAPETEARFALARQVADAVLLEGHALHPHRPSTAENRLRRQFGILVPPAWRAESAEYDEYDFQHTECLLVPRAGATLAVELRFLRARRRTVQRARLDGEFETVPELPLGDQVLVPQDEGTEERVAALVPVSELMDGDGVTIPFGRPADEESEPVLDGAGGTVGRVIRRHEEISGALRLSAHELELDGPHRVARLTAVVENTGTWTPADSEAADRDAALSRSLVATHLLMGLNAGSFLSMTDPPEWARGATTSCRNLHTWPVLAGQPGRADVMLSSPVILEDHPALAQARAHRLPADSGKVLVAGIGNVFLGDDGFGVETARALSGRQLPGHVEVADIGVRGVHLAYQLLDGYDTLILVDATARGGDPGTLYVIEHDSAIGDDPQPAPLDGHRMTPDAVLALLGTLCAGTGSPPPRRTLVVGCEPASLEERIGLSPPVSDAVPEAVRLIEGILRADEPYESAPGALVVDTAR